MKAPHYCSAVKYMDENEITASVSNTSKVIRRDEATTSDLLKWISQVTDKRKQIRRKTRCSNLLAESVLSNTLRAAKAQLAKKQEEKRKKLKSFTYQLKVTSQIIPRAEREFLCKDSAFELDDQVKSCLASLDSFFNDLNRAKV